MRTFVRLMQGASLSWGRILVLIVAQILTVPVFLSRWDGERFGYWLIVNGLFGYLSLVSTAFQQFTYGEALKLGPSSIERVRELYFASLPVAYGVALVELAAVVLFGDAVIGSVVHTESGLVEREIYILLVAHAAMNFVLMPFGAITSQTLTLWGFFPGVAAEGLIRALTSSVAPALAVFFGAGFTSVGFVLIGAHAVPAVVAAFFWARLAKQRSLFEPTPVRWRQGVSHLCRSLPLAGQTFVGSFRQQGMRLVLSSGISAASVAVFSTTRTFANALQKGLPTIVAPLMPELMRYIAAKDQDRLEGAFAVVWLMVLTLLTPGSLLLLLVGHPLFLVWTRGEVEFDPVLYMLLSATVLVFGCGQPAMAILRGRNLVAWQTLLSVLIALSTLAFLVLLMPAFGLRGVGLALFVSELGTVVLAFRASQLELERLGLRMPWTGVVCVVGGTLGASAIALVACFEAVHLPSVLFLGALVNAGFALLYWRSLPQLARDYFRKAIERIVLKLTRRSSASNAGIPR